MPAYTRLVKSSFSLSEFCNCVHRSQNARGIGQTEGSRAEVSLASTTKANFATYSNRITTASFEDHKVNITCSRTTYPPFKPNNTLETPVYLRMCWRKHHISSLRCLFATSVWIKSYLIQRFMFQTVANLICLLKKYRILMQVNSTKFVGCSLAKTLAEGQRF
jgi:hypothetical protein